MVTVVLPLPPDGLRVNATAGRHWGEVYAAKQEYRLEAWPKLQEQRWEWEGESPSFPIHLYLTVYLGKGQRCDLPDVGTWCKYPLDLLVQAGAFPDDSAKYIRPFTVDVQRDWGWPRIEFSWEELP